ncbi:MAG: hypothetical protein ACI835_000036 [Planctomycetota bacterium]|jgi:hypothetical protein
MGRSRRGGRRRIRTECSVSIRGAWFARSATRQGSVRLFVGLVLVGANRVDTVLYTRLRGARASAKDPPRAEVAWGQRIGGAKERFWAVAMRMVSPGVDICNPVARGALGEETSAREVTSAGFESLELSDPRTLAGRPEGAEERGAYRWPERRSTAPHRGDTDLRTTWAGLAGVCSIVTVQAAQIAQLVCDR